MKKEIDQYLSLVIFYVIILSLSFLSFNSYVGDYIEKTLSFLGIFLNYFVLIALFSIYKKVKIFSRKQMFCFAYLSIFLCLFSYAYPYFKYSEQNPASLISSFFYDLSITVLIFTILFKDARNGHE